MNLIDEMLKSIGGEDLVATGLSFYVQNGVGGYFQGVEKILDISKEKVILKIKKGEVLILGSNLKLSRYFDKDLVLSGKIYLVEIKNGNG